MGQVDKVVVIGAGITGLACAYRLQELGIRPVVLEASGRAGGAITTVRRNAFVFEGGPQFPRFPEAVGRLVQSLGIEKEFLAGDAKAKRYILRDGRLHVAPFSAGGLLSTGLVGVSAKAGLLSEAFRNSQPPEEEESLAEFVQRKFGKEVLDYLVDPVISAIFFGDADKMGMESAFPVLVEWERNRGSVVRGAIGAYRSKQKEQTTSSSKSEEQTNAARMAVTDALPALGTFRMGMATLTEKLAERLKEAIKFGASVESVTTAVRENGDGPGWRVRVSGGEEILADAVVVAVPAYAAGAMLQDCAPEMAELLSAMEYASLGVVASAYRREDVGHAMDGFGFMAPRREGLQTICTFWNSSLFPKHAAEGMVLMTSFARGEGEGSDEELARRVEGENARTLSIRGGALDRAVWQYPKALPQYTVGHAKRVAKIREMVGQMRGLFVAGNYLSGRSIGDCVEEGWGAAERVMGRG